MLTSTHLLVLLPVLVLVAGACLLLLTEAFLKSGDRRYQAPLAALTALAALALDLFELAGDLPNGPILKGAARADTFQAIVGAAVCAGLFLSLLLSSSFLKRLDAERGEYYALMLFAACGMQLLAMSDDLVMIFIALEIMSLSTYALAAWLRRTQRSTEAAFKYFILGAASSAIYLYGAALAWGATGSTSLNDIASGCGSRPHPELVGPAIALLVGGFAFKVAAVPFHMWAPDVYEGAPTPVTAFMAVGVKAAAFAAFFRVIAVGFHGSTQIWLPVVVTLALLTMVVGNLVALPQRNVKRMLAYSSIAHAGYLLVALAAAGSLVEAGGQALLFYLGAYVVTAVGAFGVAALVERSDDETGAAWDLDRFAGLSRRRPVLAAFMATFLLSLAGVPPTAGFMAKLLVFRAALDAGQIPLAIVGVITSAAGAYYYLRVVVYMYFRAPEPDAKVEPALPALEWALGIACVGVFLLGLAPGALAELARRGAQLLF